MVAMLADGAKVQEFVTATGSLFSILLQYGADRAIREYGKKTPVDAASNYPVLLQLLSPRRMRVAPLVVNASGSV